MTLVLLTEQELASLKNQSEYDFTIEDWIALIEHSDVFKKIARKAMFDIQLSIWAWSYIWRETQAYASIEGINQVIKLIDDVKSKIQEYQQDEMRRVEKEILKQ